MKHCLICNQGYDNEPGYCPVCGFQFLKTLDDSATIREELLSRIESETEKIMSNIKISFVVYSYSEGIDGVLELEKEIELCLATGPQLSLNKIIWYQEEFIGVKRDYEITVLIRNIKGEERRHSLSMEYPGCEGLWQIGVILLNGLNVKIVIGNQDSYKESAPIKLYE